MIIMIVNCIIGNETFTYTTDIRDNLSQRKSFDELAQKTFGLSFEHWYQLGYWTDHYVPHVLVTGGEVVANVSVNIIDSLLGGQPKRFIQLGTVMTDEHFRRRGLSAFLIKQILQEWEPRCDGIYLYANDSVLDFYPRFGFISTLETEYSMAVPGGKAEAVRLDMTNPADVDFLLTRYRAGNPFSALPMLRSEGLLMFYCAQFLKENVYRVDNAAVVAAFEGNLMRCYDVFAPDEAELGEILMKTAQPETRTAVLSFTPIVTAGLLAQIRREPDTTLFWHSSKPDIFREGDRMFPLLSHA